MDYPAAMNPLIISGVPATVEHMAAGITSAAFVAECVQNFITTMDSLKLNMTVFDQVFPLLPDLSGLSNKLSILPPDFEGKTKMEWIGRLAKMGLQMSRLSNFIKIYSSILFTQGFKLDLKRLLSRLHAQRIQIT